MSLARSQLAGLDPDVRSAAEYTLDIADHFGIPVTVTSGLRTYEEQDRLYRRFLAGGSRFPAAPPGRSAHEHGLAFDSVVAPAHLDAWDYIRNWVGFETRRTDEVHAVVPNWRDFVR